VVPGVVPGVVPYRRLRVVPLTHMVFVGR